MAKFKTSNSSGQRSLSSALPVRRTVSQGRGVGAAVTKGDLLFRRIFKVRPLSKFSPRDFVTFCSFYFYLRCLACNITHLPTETCSRLEIDCYSLQRDIRPQRLPRRGEREGVSHRRGVAPMPRVLFRAGDLICSSRHQTLVNESLGLTMCKPCAA